MAQTVKITPASGLLEFIGNTTTNKPYLQHDDNGNLTLTLQATKKFTVAGNLKVNGKVTMVQQTLTDGAAITWDFNSGANSKVTIAGARTLVITNMEAGDTGLILVKQDAVGGRTLILPGSSTIVGGGTYTASSAANATDVLGVYYDGTTYWWTIGYNTVTPPLTSVGITGGDFVIANSPLTSNGNIGLALATVNSNVGTFGSATAVPVITVNAKGLVTAVSATNISIPTNLDSLTDVTISSAATGQLLQFNGSQWVNWTPNYLTGITSSQVTTALGYTPVPTTRTLSINGTSYDLSANRAWTISSVDYVSRVQHEVKAGVAINKGQAVYATGADGTNIIVGLASNTSEATSSKTMGLLDATVATNGFANVVTEGLLTNIDTSQAGTAGDPVWLGQNGNLIYGLPNKPYAPNHLVFIGIVTRKNANVGEIFVKVQNGFELKEIHDADLITTTPINGHILGYNGTLWVNKTIAGWLGFTPANDANVVHTTGNESIAGIKTFSGTTQATSTSTGTIVTAGGVGIAKNLYVGGNINVVGNLVIGGTTTTVYAQNLAVSDNMIYLNNGIETTITNAVGNGSSVVYTTQETHNYIIGMSVTITGVSPSAYNLSNQTITGVSTNSFTIANSATGSYSSGGTARAKSNANPDLGFAAGYNDGSYAHAGLFRDATDNTWKFFKGYTPEPDASPFIDTSHASFAYADLRADNITGRSFIKVGGVSSEFLKADGSVDSNTYLTTGTASSTYQPLDGDLTAIAGLATTGFLKRTGTNTWSLDSNTYLTSYTETDTLASVTGRGSSTNTAVTFNSNVTLGNNADLVFRDLSGTFPTSGKGFDWELNNDGARIYAIQPSSDSIDLVFQLRDNATTNDRFVWHVDDYQGPAFDKYPLIIRGGTEFDLVSSSLYTNGILRLSNAGVLQNVTGNISMFTNDSGYITSAPLSGYVPTSRTLTINGTTYDLSANRSWTITAGVSSVSAGAGISVNSTTGAVTVTNTITNLNQLTNGPGYITGYTETDTLASVTARGSSTNSSIFINGIFTGGLGAVTTSGTLDWNDVSNARAGQGYTLLLGTATNGMGGGQYYHPVSFEYSSKNGGGNMTQLAIPYTGNGIWYRSKYGGSWSSWARVWDDSSFTSTNITNWNTAYGWGNHASQSYATTSYVTTQINNLINGAPGVLDTLDELAAALGDDANFATTITTSIGNKVSKAGDTMTGNLAFGATSGLGLTWGLNTDAAFIKFISSGNQAGGSYLEIGTQDDLDEEIKFTQSGNVRFYLATDGRLKTGSGYNYIWDDGTWSISITGNAATVTNGVYTNGSYANPAWITSLAWSKITGAPAFITGYTETDTLASVTGRGATTSTTLTLAKVITTGLYGPSTGGNVAIWQYDASNTGYGIVYNEGSPDTLRIDVSGQALTGTPDFLVGADYAQVNGNNVWHAGNLTNLNQLTNGPAYITTNGRAYPRRADGTNINFYWTGQSGQPSWLWGSNNGEDFYVWNPSNFSVNYASSAGSASTAGYATEAKWISFEDGPRDLTDRRPNWNNRSVAWDFVTAGTADGVGNYAGVMTFSPWDGTSASTGDSSYQLAFINENGVNASGIPGLRLRNGIDSTWNNWYQVWHSGNFTNNSSNWNTAYSKRPTALAFSGTGTKTLTLTLGDSSTLTASFSDIDTNTDAQTLSLSGSTLSISGGNSITLPTSGISQGTADSLYVNVSGDEMTGNLYISPISANPAQIQLAGTNPELYVSAKTGTARVFINREGSGHQATLMFTTGMNVFQGTAWNYTGVPMWSMGMTNTSSVNSFKLGYGDVYDANSVGLEITTANVAYFKYVPYAAGNLLATQAWVTSQGYLTALPSHNHDDRYYTESEIDSQISNRLYQARVSGLDFNAFNGTGLYRGSTSGWTNRPLSQHNGGALLQIDTHPGDYHSQLYFDTGADRLYFRNANGGSWGSWLVMLHSSNIGSYAWTSSNDGAGSGLDADLLDGYNSDTAANVNTIVRRDSSGNIYSNYVLGTYFNASQGNSENPTIGQIWTQNTSDNYLRKSTPSHFRSQITDSYYLSLSGGTVSGNVNLTGQLAFLDGNNGFSNIIRSAAYPSEGYPDGVNYWMEYRAYGGHHFVLNVDGGVGSGANTMDDFVVWQGAIDGNKLLEVSNTGTLTIADRLIELSSIRYKTNVESLTPALDKVLQLRPVYYTKISGTGSTEIGLIAEEVAEIYPELIKYDDAGQVDGINYTRIAPILIKTIQEQQELIKNLTKRIDDLENR